MVHFVFREQDAAYREQLSALRMSPEEVDAAIAKIRAGFGKNGFDRPAVFQGAPEKLRDSSGEIVEIISRAGGDVQRTLASLRKQVEDAEAAVCMSAKLPASVKKKAKAALQTAQRLQKNALDGLMLAATLTIEKSVRKHLRIAKSQGWVRECNEADVEDIIADAWLEQHSEKAILACLQKAELKNTPENIERAYQMIAEEMISNPKVSALGARFAAERWKENKRQLREVSLETPVAVSEEGSAILLREALQPTFEDSRDYLPSKAAQKFKADTVLTPAELKWLADYNAARERKGKRGAKRSRKPHSQADRQRAARLKKKAERRLKEIL